ncbi:hypothetical protein TWF718_002147 [Orbilia javanica]|uniref:Uncharacterized protein n=1 Tax=Orbilia javanica TaxID=47235 RepID=A0AAN8MM24_9PEZI
MANRVKSYFLVPAYDFAPDAIKLGGVVRSVLKPTDYSTEVLPLDSQLIEKSAPVFYCDTLTQTFGYGGGVFAEFLKYVFGIGAGTGVGTTGAETMEIVCEKLETHCFNPTKDYMRDTINRVLGDGVLERSLRSRFFGSREKLFMITGIKIAEGVKISTSQMKGLDFRAQVGADATLMGVPGAGGGVGLELVWKDARVAELKTKGQIVIAYRVTKIVRKPRGDVKGKTIKRGALMGGEFAEYDIADGFELENSQDLDNDGFADFGIENQPTVITSPTFAKGTSI